MRALVFTLMLAALAATAATAAEPARVAAARAARGDAVAARFAAAGVAYPARELVVRVLKAQDRLEVWAGPGAGAPLVHVVDYPVCARSGTLGPKRRQGDLQVPEGFYLVDRMNPWSNFHLSIGVDYPNAADRVAARRLHDGPLGGDIFIHGDCVTIGCVPIEDESIEELYLMVLDTRATRGARVEVHLLPDTLDDASLDAHARGLPADDERRALWANLAAGARRFDETHRPLRWTIDARGRYVFPSSTTR